MLFYKVGPNPRQWWGMLKTSDDGGHRWSDAIRLPDGILGPIKNKPIQLDNGDILSPTSIELFTDPNDDANPRPTPSPGTPGESRGEGSSSNSGSSSLPRRTPTQPSGGVPGEGIKPHAATTVKSPESGWHVYFERSRDGGKAWTATPWVPADAGVKAIQPSILIHSQTRLQAIGRTKSARLFETWSDDAGKTWSKLALTELPNCNSGTDAVTLRDGRHLLVYNHSAVEKVRYPLNVAVTPDGKNWQGAAVLDTEPPGQYSYPAVIQASDGRIHICYTWKRLKIKHVIIDLAGLKTAPIVAGNWPVGIQPFCA
jgi:hypothetical protein